MNINIIKPNDFTLLPWKNGLGHTTELAINQGGSLEDFDWRLSIASVVTNGAFSNFSGYQRNLVLIEGNGLTLDHQNGTCDQLTKILDVATFDGGCHTLGLLNQGGIKDFNIMTKKSTMTAKVKCYRDSQKIVVNLNQGDLCFAYSLTNSLTVESLVANQGDRSVPLGCLVKILTLGHQELTFNVKGENMIVVQLQTTSIK